MVGQLVERGLAELQIPKISEFGPQPGDVHVVFSRVWRPFKFVVEPNDPPWRPLGDAAADIVAAILSRSNAGPTPA
jgi:hypothetical protein